MKMKRYTLGIRIAKQTQLVLEIPALTMNEAKDEWSRITGYDGDLWDKKNKTYFGWPVIQTKIKALKRKSDPDINPFSF